MKTCDFEKQLKEINEHLNIKPAAVSDMEGIYYDSIFITGIPSQNIYEEHNENYKNDLGTPHKIISRAISDVNLWLSNLDEMLELEKDFNEVMKSKQPQQILK